jgi:hypothetical protein
MRERGMPLKLLPKRFAKLRDRGARGTATVLNEKAFAAATSQCGTL